VILTGNLTCGTEGIRAIKASGGLAVVQSDPQFPGMPQSAKAHAEVDHLVPLRSIAALLGRLVTESVPAQDEAEAQGAHTVAPQHSQIVCPSCQGSMVETVEGGLLRYRCHVGHAFSVDSLLAEQSEALEAALDAEDSAALEPGTLES